MGGCGDILFRGVAESIENKQAINLALKTYSILAFIKLPLLYIMLTLFACYCLSFVPIHVENYISCILIIMIMISDIRSQQSSMISLLQVGNA